MGATPGAVRNRRLMLLAGAVAIVVGAYFLLDLGHYLSLSYFKQHQAALDAQFRAHPLRTAGLFALLYLCVTSLSIPGTVLLTLSAGAIFGVFWGTLIVSFSSACGATLAFLSSRYLLRDWVQHHFGAQLETFNRGMERDGAFYLVSLGLIPVFPYSVINLVMGITPIRITTFYWASQTGMLLETILVVNAGTQIAQIDSLTGLLSPTLIVSLALLGLVPLVLRKLLTHEKMPQRWRRNNDQ